MKKSGFTLTELVITVGIIGVAAILTMPTIINIIPDKNKLKVLQYYSKIHSTINEILSDPEIYHPYTKEGDPYFLTINGEDPCVGIGCIEEDVFEEELIRRLKLQTDEEGKNKFQDGVEFIIDNSGNERKISLKINDADECTSNTLLDSPTTGCSGRGDVNTFKFTVDNFGGITTNDYLLKAYLANPNEMNNKEKDYKAAKEFKDAINFSNGGTCDQN